MTKLKLLHFSDFHFGRSNLPLKSALRPDFFLTKRLVGLANQHFNKHRTFSRERQKVLLQEALETDWDYLVYTGDATILGSKEEFETARKAFEPLIERTQKPERGKLLFTVGNHDRYTKDTLGRMEATFKDVFPFNQAPQNHPFHIVDDRGYLIVEVPTACPRSILSSQGKFSGDLKSYQNLFKAYPGYKKILYGHYSPGSPAGYKEPRGHQLENPEPLLELLREEDIILYLHGHVHRSWHFQPWPDRGILSVNAGGSLNENAWQLTLKGAAIEFQPL